MMKRMSFSIFLVVFFSSFGKAVPVNKIQTDHDANKIVVPLGGNSWATNGAAVSNNGLKGWESTATSVTTYVWLANKGMLNLSINMNPAGKSTIRVTIQGISKNVMAEGNAEAEFYAGKWDGIEPGYVAVELRGISKTGVGFGTVSSFVISGSAVSPETAFVKDNKDNYFYWGRRGPSVHLNYTIPSTDITTFYSELTVPEGNDVIGSYFMANGFAEGYFGIQVNSSTERRILFSVFKITMLKKGNNVYTGEFGNEGAGGQSYLVFPWKAGNTYKFLLRGEPQQDNSTIYTAYFFAPEAQKWLLIASFKRPATYTYLKRLHSFLENFMPNTGNQQRMALYGNAWVMDKNGIWTAINAARFTADQTARKRFRLDYAGGVMRNTFFLKNCGFFVPSTPIDSQFNIEKPAQHPVIDFSKLQ
jgi:hypothetical protein